MVILLLVFGNSDAIFSFDGTLGSVFVDLERCTAAFCASAFFSPVASSFIFLPAVATEVVDFMEPTEGDLRSVGVFVPDLSPPFDADALTARIAILDAVDFVLASDERRGRLFEKAGATGLAALRTDAVEVADALLAREEAVSRVADAFLDVEDTFEAPLLELDIETFESEDEGRS